MGRMWQWEKKPEAKSAKKNRVDLKMDPEMMEWRGKGNTALQRENTWLEKPSSLFFNWQVASVNFQILILIQATSDS